METLPPLSPRSVFLVRTVPWSAHTRVPPSPRPTHRTTKDLWSLVNTNPKQGRAVLEKLTGPVAAGCFSSRVGDRPSRCLEASPRKWQTRALRYWIFSGIVGHCIVCEDRRSQVREAKKKVWSPFTQYGPRQLAVRKSQRKT